MVAGTGLEGLCTVADTPETMRAALERLMQENFGEAQLQVRREGLRAYGPQEGIKPILGLLAEGA
jgi:hypothetical protein